MTVSSAGSVSIVGTGQSITGNGNRVFQVEKGGNLILQDVTITGGTVTSTGNAQGGGIEDLGGNVILSNATVRGNSVSGFHADGGGIFVSGNGNLTVQGGSVIESNRAVGIGSAAGGGIYVSANGPGFLTIRDSTIRKNGAQGSKGAYASEPGGSAFGGGVYVGGSGWTATLTGDMLSGNSVIGGNGGNGAAGGNAVGTNTSGGGGGYGGYGGAAQGGGAYFSGNVIVALKILNDDANPALFVDNSVQGGNGGNGGNGGTSTGTAKNANGGDGGSAGIAGGGALYISTSHEAVVDKIGNTTFYGNSVLGGNGGTGGAAGTGGFGAAGSDGTNQNGARAEGGGIVLQSGNISMVNCTVAKNIATAGGEGATLGTSLGGGLFNYSQSANLDNNTIAQNKIGPGFGGGVYLSSTNPLLVNNLIQGNLAFDSSATDLDTSPGDTLTAATDNFITSVGPNAHITGSNIIGNTQTQLGGVVGVTTNGQPSGGPIYYPLLPGVVSIGAGTTQILDTIGYVEGPVLTYITDEIGNRRSTDDTLDLGAVQYQGSSSPSAPVITSNPSNQTVMAGANVSFTASASGTPTPTVQWQVSSDDGKTFSSIRGATSTTLTLNGVTVAMNGYEYQAVFTNSAGSAASSAATLTVNAPPSITGNPSNQSVTAGANVSFTALASGNPTPTVQWQISTDGGTTFTNISGATSTTLTLNNVTTNMNGDAFQAVFTNSAGSATTTRRHPHRQRRGVRARHPKQSHQPIGDGGRQCLVHRFGQRQSDADRAMASQHGRRQDVQQHQRCHHDHADAEQCHYGHEWIRVPSRLHQ